MARPAQQAKFVTGSLLWHVAVMSLTSSVGLMAVFSVDLVNMIYISMLRRAELAAAVGYAGAIVFFIVSFGIGMSSAASALVARAVGARDMAAARAKATSGLVLVLGVGFGAVSAAVVWVFLSPLVTLLGTTGQTHAVAVDYLQIIIPSQPLRMVGMIGGAVLRSHGDARRAMMATIWGGVATAVRDPILIFALGWELTGAAIASVAARVVMAGLGLLPIIVYHGGLDRPSVAGAVADLRPVYAIVFPAILRS